MLSSYKKKLELARARISRVPRRTIDAHLIRGLTVAGPAYGKTIYNLMAQYLDLTDLSDQIQPDLKLAIQLDIVFMISTGTRALSGLSMDQEDCLSIAELFRNELCIPEETDPSKIRPIINASNILLGRSGIQDVQFRTRIVAALTILSPESQARTDEQWATIAAHYSVPLDTLTSKDLREIIIISAVANEHRARIRFAGQFFGLLFAISRQANFQSSNYSSRVQVFKSEFPAAEALSESSVRHIWPMVKHFVNQGIDFSKLVGVMQEISMDVKPDSVMFGPLIEQAAFRGMTTPKIIVDALKDHLNFPWSTLASLHPKTASELEAFHEVVDIVGRDKYAGVCSSGVGTAFPNLAYICLKLMRDHSGHSSLKDFRGVGSAHSSVPYSNQEIADILYKQYVENKNKNVVKALAGIDEVDGGGLSKEFIRSIMNFGTDDPARGEKRRHEELMDEERSVRGRTEIDDGEPEDQDPPGIFSPTGSSGHPQPPDSDAYDLAELILVSNQDPNLEFKAGTSFTASVGTIEYAKGKTTRATTLGAVIRYLQNWVRSNRPKSEQLQSLNPSRWTTIVSNLAQGMPTVIKEVPLGKTRKTKAQPTAGSSKDAMDH
nr:TPA_asm: uncharacterized protein [Micrarchus hystriculeus mononega-like virus 1]